MSAKKYEELCEHCSERELIASTAERASIKYKQTEFMADRIGQEFDGVISGVTEFGIYVEDVLSKCEGMVPMRDLSSDYYEFDEDNYRLVGRRTRRVYNLGDKVRFRVERANMERRQLDFSIIEEDSLMTFDSQSSAARSVLQSQRGLTPERFGKKKANKRAKSSGKSASASSKGKKAAKKAKKSKKRK